MKQRDSISNLLLFITIFFIGVIKAYSNSNYIDNPIVSIFLCLICSIGLFIFDSYTLKKVTFEKNFFWYIPSIIFGIFLIKTDIDLIVKLWYIADLKIVIYSINIIIFYSIYFLGIFRGKLKTPSK